MVKTTLEETEYRQPMMHLGYNIAIGSDMVIFDDELVFTAYDKQKINKILPFKQGTFFEAVELDDGRAALRRVEIKDGQYRRTDK